MGLGLRNVFVRGEDVRRALLEFPAEVFPFVEELAHRFFQLNGAAVRLNF